MKRFLSFFYTVPIKIIMVVTLFVISVFIGKCQVRYLTLFNEDNESFVNAMAQIDSFNYESSRYFKNTVKNTVENVVLVSMKYEEIFQKDISAEDFLAYCSSIGDTTFPKVYSQLKNMKGLRFALVNLDNHHIYSNIDEINGKASTTDIRNYFGEVDKTLMIARNCKNPYFATNFYIDFADMIRNCAKNYEDDFDLYISFGSESDFSEREEYCRQLHFDMRERIEDLNNTVAFLLVTLLFNITIIVTVTGKIEPGGKTYPSVMNRLPNDLLLIIYTIVLGCISSLYRTTITMITTHGTELDEFWFTHSETFYNNRTTLCVVIFICAATDIICILKRQYKMGKLFKNTLLYDFVLSISKKHKPDENTADNS